ncbi:3-methyladenine DNA glycosylase [Halobacteriovorax marinus]|uniref:DNA-3-methyladenine glycosylase I n=1 Tax=Halobacteriovorax marinus TaxID=97084 RepID=UPI000BC314B6|nr:DNA-3-methyladenine glycosylase I [Halobacteriovorax marinus]ATH08897.1 3-methyladenine DNA glycosylase [Halobacteriovorax marinus]
MVTAVKCEDGKKRCKWCIATPEYMSYHDTEWGFPVHDDQRLFEKICLEGFQSGLSWRTILTKRENFRKAFKNFDFNKVSKFKESDVERLLKDEGIIRHRGKIEATINNAKMAKLVIKEYGSLANYFWSFKPKQKRKSTKDISTSEESIALSKDLKRRGWKFVGPTTMYAFMQAMGMVNDHAKSCYLRDLV